MLINEYNFDLPGKLIAQSPTLPRDYARLLIYHKSDGSMSLGHFYDLPKLLRPGDVLVFNDTKVIPARLKMEMNGKTNEILFLERYADKWKCMVKPGKRFRKGVTMEYSGLHIKVEEIDNDGYRILSLNLSEGELLDFLHKHGEMPVPPYITGSGYKNEDYNTVYASKAGSVAAPTAGLHFTPGLISRLKSAGVIIEYITLNVGLGTFLPVKEKNVDRHKMHFENYSLDFLTVKRLNRYMTEKRRIIAVGTTSVRTLESNIKNRDSFWAGNFNTNIFIKPGYEWRAVDGIITNFHLPKSTLIMLVAAMIGRKETFRVYDYAKKHGLRFYSFGDGMIIV